MSALIPEFRKQRDEAWIRNQELIEIRLSPKKYKQYFEELKTVWRYTSLTHPKTVYFGAAEVVESRLLRDYEALYVFSGSLRKKRK